MHTLTLTGLINVIIKNRKILKRRDFIKTSGMALAAAGITKHAFTMNINSKAIDDKNIIGHGNYKYRVNKEWGNLDPAKAPVLNCHEMVLDSSGRLIMITDEIKNNIIIYDKSGKLLETWGTWFPGGHGLTLSKEGEEDFLFITDCGYFLGKDGKTHSQAGRVVKMTIDGRLVFNIGHPSTIGVYKPEDPFRPTEVAVAPNGDFYVADGYGMDYILHYNAKGAFIRKFGGKDNKNEEENLVNAHGVAFDSRDPDDPKLICTSRTENCFKFFAMDGKYIKTIELPGLYVCRPVVDDNNIYAGVCWSKTREDNKGWVKDTGFVTILENDKVVSNPGGTEPIYENGKVQQMYQDSRIFNHGHDVCVDEDKNLYICQWNACKTYPVKLERI
jgi:hypothetical protein